MMTDIWCFTCDHEIKLNINGRYGHLNSDDAENGCVCTEEGLECEPR